VLGRRNKYSFLLLIIGAVFLLFVAACDTSPVTETALKLTEIYAQESTLTSSAVTETPSPTVTSLPAMALLLTPSGVDPTLAAGLESLLVELAQADGLEFQVVSVISPETLDDNVRVVVVLPPDPGVRDLAAAFPQTQFLSVGIVGVEPENNLSVIGAQGDRPDQQGFIAGYMAAVITPQWRVGVISTGETGPGNAASRAFMNGAVFFCGLCRPSVPPFFEYPTFYDLPITANQTDRQLAVDFLVKNGVQTVYVYPDVSDPALLKSLAEADLVLIGGGPPPDTIKHQWAASIGPDWLTPVREAWSQVVSGNGGFSMPVILVISEQNSDLFSPGRQRLVESTLSEMLAGYIDTGVDPLTGEPR